MFRAKDGIPDTSAASTPVVDAFIRLPRVLQLVGLSRASVYERVANGSFPSPVPVGSGRVAWVESEVRRWMSDCVARRDTSASTVEQNQGE